MTRDDPEKEALFLRFWPALICIVFFLLVIILIGIPKWICKFFAYHTRKLLRMKNTEERADFIYEFAKNLDCGANVSAFGGQHDETISNRAGTIWLDKGFASPWWVLWVKKITDRVDPKHCESSIEPLRPKTRRKHD